MSEYELHHDKAHGSQQKYRPNTEAKQADSKHFSPDESCIGDESTVWGFRNDRELKVVASQHQEKSKLLHQAVASHHQEKSKLLHQAVEHNKKHATASREVRFRHLAALKRSLSIALFPNGVSDCGPQSDKIKGQERTWE